MIHTGPREPHVHKYRRRRVNAEKEGRLTLFRCACGHQYSVQGWDR